MTEPLAAFLINSALALLILQLPLLAVETPPVFPLWDGKESVASYAQRVNLPVTRSLDLGGGIALELVLIPAGQFIMGSAEPVKPSVTATAANWLIGLGGGTAVLLLLDLAIRSIKKRKLSFSLRWLLLMMIGTGVCIGGFARRNLALKEAARYESELEWYSELPADEKPAHAVTLTQPFYMGKYTITQEQYTALMGTNRSNIKGARLPVVEVSWDDSIEFCRKLNGILDDKTLEVRLPTEAQWEYAYLAGTHARFYLGENYDDLNSMGWNSSNSGLTMHPVGEKKANSFGLYDMHGNVDQWCEDFYADHYESPPAIDPVNKRGTDRVVRGGSWISPPGHGRSSSRGRSSPSYRYYIWGFRVALILSSKNL